MLCKRLFAGATFPGKTCRFRFRCWLGSNRPERNRSSPQNYGFLIWFFWVGLPLQDEIAHLRAKASLRDENLSK